MATNARDTLASHLRVYLSGDVASKRFLIGVEQPDLADAAAQVAPLTVDAGCVLRMLTGLESGRMILSEAQAWASFVRAGYFPRLVPGAVTSLDIGVTGAGADEVARIIARFDELGDVSDEPLGDDELAAMIAAMRSASEQTAS
jgi:hypothetical protein